MKTNSTTINDQKYHQQILQMRLLDDDFMNKFFDGQPELTELVIKIILGRDDITVKEVTSQREYKGIQGRSIRLDIFAVDDQGKIYNIEIQRANRTDLHKRIRYHSSMLDTKALESGSDFCDLPETYVIFILEHDSKTFPNEESIRIVHRKYDDSDEVFDDGTHIILVNASYKNDTSDIGKLMHDFRCVTADNMFFEPLATRLHYFKTEGGTGEMCQIVEDLIKKEAREAAIKFIQKGYADLNDIAECLDLPLSEVEELEKSINK